MSNPTSSIHHSKPKLLTLEEVAVILQVSRRSVDRYIKLGHLTAVQISPRKLRVAEDDLDKFIDEMRRLNS